MWRPLYLSMFGKRVQQDLLKLFTGHAVVQVGHLDVCAVGEGLRRGAAVGTGAPGCAQGGRAIGQAGGATPAGRDRRWRTEQALEGHLYYTAIYGVGEQCLTVVQQM